MQITLKTNIAKVVYTNSLKLYLYVIWDKAAGTIISAGTVKNTLYVPPNASKTEDII